MDPETIETIGAADLVIGLLDATHEEETRSGLAMTREAIAGLPDIQRVVLVCRNGTPPTGPRSDAGTPAIFLYNLREPAAAATPLESIAAAWRGVLDFGDKLDARACGIVASHPQSLTSDWIRRLVQPVVELGFDLVAPRYVRHRMEGLLNRAIFSPLFRALYGEQLQSPLGPDFGLSGRLLRQLLESETAPRPRAEASLIVSLSSLAARSGFAICESCLGERSQVPIEGTNLSTLLVQVLGPVFIGMERQAAFWQRIRASKPAPRFGKDGAIAEEAGPVDIEQMIESFQLGSRNLGDVWGTVLPPGSLLELRKLSRLPAAEFRMPDELWVRTIYDFALGHRLQNISRDHLLRSITPIYLGWIASYALELKAAAPPDVEARLERLAVAFETNKPYLVSRWRWPDRFNP